MLDMILKMGKSHENKDERLSLHRHPLHQHPLRLQAAEGPYKCNGCKQPGLGRCYKCTKDICDFYFHVACFRTKNNINTSHIFLEECGDFDFHESPPRVGDKYCDACGLDILGFRYECQNHGENPHDLHPTCATIKFEMEWDNIQYELRDNVETKCSECKQRYPAEECIGFTGWKWVSDKTHYGRFPFCFWGKKNCFHVKCMNHIMAPKKK